MQTELCRVLIADSPFLGQTTRRFDGFELTYVFFNFLDTRRIVRVCEHCLTAAGRTGKDTRSPSSGPGT
jgi:hypothetical protein